MRATSTFPRGTARARRSGVCRGAAAVSICATLLLPLGAQGGQSKVFGDWAVACDNTLRCEALGSQADPAGGGDESDEEPASEPVAFWLGRNAGPATALEARITVATQDGLIQPLTITVQGRRIRLAGGKDDVRLTPKQARELIALFADARRAEVTDGNSSWRLSLAGFKAAMLYIDEQQGRLETGDALVSKGDRPAAAVRKPAAPPVVRPATLPRQQAADAQLLPAILAEVKERECFDEVRDAAKPYTQLVRVSDRQALVLRECWRGPYQNSSQVWLANLDKPHEPRRLALPDADGAQNHDIADAEFSADDGRLYSRAKGRGIGDCIWTWQWVWTGTGFKLVDARESPLCKGFAGGAFGLRTWTATVESTAPAHR
jgi:hypothetical protein